MRLNINTTSALITLISCFGSLVFDRPPDAYFRSYCRFCLLRSALLSCRWIHNCSGRALAGIECRMGSNVSWCRVLNGIGILVGIVSMLWPVVRWGSKTSLATELVGGGDSCRGSVPVWDGIPNWPAALFSLTVG